MRLIEFIQNNRLRLEEDLRDSPRRWQFSPARRVLRYSIIPRLQQYVQGDVLDVGCGQMPFRSFLADRFNSYVGLDFERRSPDTLYIGDAQDMKDVPSDRFDTVISVCVLEHLPHPSKAIAEMARVCKPGGRIIVTTPFLARFHEEPNDYFRYTRYALELFAAENNLVVIANYAHGGIFTFMGHQVSTIVVSLTWGIPVIRWLFFWLNYLLVVRPAYWLDHVITFGGKLPLGHFCVYEKPASDKAAGEASDLRENAP